jgi:ketosteroid isomerase-like protein
MSQENMDLVAAIMGKFKATQRPTGLTTPDFVWEMRTFRGWPDEDEYQGDDGFMAFFAKWTAPYDEWDMDVEHQVDAGDDRIVAVIRQRGRLRGADSWVELRFGIVCTVAGRLIRRMQAFETPAEAFEAVGLRE